MNKHNTNHILMALSFAKKTSILILSPNESDALSMFYKQKLALNISDFDLISGGSEDYNFLATLKDNSLIIEPETKEKYCKKYNLFKRLKIRKIELNALKLGYFTQKLRIQNDKTILKDWTYFTFSTFKN